MPRSRAHRHLLGQPDHALHEQHLVGVAAVQERAAGPLDDRHLVARQEPVDGLRVQRLAVPEPVDRQLALRGGGGHAASSVAMCPSRSSTRASAGSRTVLVERHPRDVVEHQAAGRREPPGQHRHPDRVARPAVDAWRGGEPRRRAPRRCRRRTPRSGRRRAGRSRGTAPLARSGPSPPPTMPPHEAAGAVQRGTGAAPGQAPRRAHRRSPTPTIPRGRAGSPLDVGPPPALSWGRHAS